MKEPRWLTAEGLLALHDLLILEHGGLSGLRSRQLLESALAHPKNLFAYERRSMAVLAAAYAAGIVRNHPFVDGNKRTAFTAAGSCLEKNGFTVRVPEEEVVPMMLGLAEKKISEKAFALWLADGVKARRRRPR
ncbi:MAG: type II toxin-antitoxin system death-on-curing family toxin [Planctomycetes bacterium]|nr:type II toxin-antitoxin system death-on-curing family toxin [Planctomycetota bacterium]MBI3846349.1 type II toxin-antitoxin system death-on-curing family toxin [Planctomycetota bacterium]